MNINMDTCKRSCWFLVLYINVMYMPTAADDLYEILGVGKFASQKEIKQAYKELAKQWHPDKNPSSDTTNKFTKINEAYETLGDQEKRAKYDQFGETAASEQQHGQQGFQQFFHGSFGGGGFTFNFGGSGAFDKHMVNMRSYTHKIEADTHQRPYIFYVYSDFCIACMQIDHLMEHLFTDLQAVGMGMGAVHAGMDGGLGRHLYVHHYPAVVGVRNGRSYHYKGPVNTPGLRQFVRSMFPANTFTTLTDENMESFIHGWSSDNKVRVLLFNNREATPVKYLVLAYMYRATMAFAIVDSKSHGTRRLAGRYRVDRVHETLVICGEEEAPVATVSMKQIPQSTMADLIQANQFLFLPRLSSNSFFNKLCPESKLSAQKKLCVVLITTKSHDQPEHVASFRRFARENTGERVKFLYIYGDVQTKLVKALTKSDNESLSGHVLKVVIIWRMETWRLGYEWLDGGWTVDNDEQSEEMLASHIKTLLNGRGQLVNKVVMPELYNEHALGLPSRMLKKLVDWSTRIYDYMTGHDSVTVTMLLFSVVMVVVVVIALQKMIAMEHENIEQQQVQASKQPRRQMYNNRPANRTSDGQIIVYELMYDTYNTLVKNSDTGLTVTLLVDQSSQDKLVHKFKEIMFPHSRYSGLTFAYVRLDLHTEWYRRLLQDSFTNKQRIDRINVRNCVGSVLAINSFRKYYYLYHPKRGQKHFLRTARSEAAGDGEGMFGSGEESSDGDSPLFEGGLLQGLSIWMDRIFDGSVQKIRIEKWHDL